MILLTTSPQESIGRRNAISPQFEDESIQQKLWDTYHCECLWKGVTKLDFHPLIRPHESRKVLQRRLTETLGRKNNLVNGNTYGRHLRYVGCAIWKPIRTNQFGGALPVISKCITSVFIMMTRQFQSSL